MRKTNEEFVNGLMSYSVYGPLTQVFIIEAIRYYSEKVSSTPEPEDDPKSILSPVVWHRIAVDLNRQLEENYANTR